MESKPVKVTMTSKAPEEQSYRLTDGGHHIISCSGCRAKLMDVFITRPHEKRTWKLRAICPFCNDKSFVAEFQGGFHYGGIAVPHDENPNEDKAVSTRVVNFVMNDDTFDFIIEKAGPNAKAVYEK